MDFSTSDLTAIGLTLRLAALVTGLLMVLATPLAWWLARTKSALKIPISVITTLPLVLPPTVLGFYLLIAFSPQSAVGEVLNLLGIGPLPFSFTGLVIASMIYSLPFVVQPIQNTFSEISDQALDAASTLGAGPIDRFFSVVIPMSKQGFFVAAVFGLCSYHWRIWCGLDDRGQYSGRNSGCIYSDLYVCRIFGSRFRQRSIGSNAALFLCHTASSLHHATQRWHGFDAF